MFDHDHGHVKQLQMTLALMSDEGRGLRRQITNAYGL